MTDIVEGEYEGHYSVTVTGPGAGEWTWTGYADHTGHALSSASNAWAEGFRWNGEIFAKAGKDEENGAPAADR